MRARGGSTGGYEMANKERDRHTILIADDAEMNRTMLRAILEDQYNIIEAADGEEALNVLRSGDSPVSVVVSDIVMPGIDGFDMLSIMESEGFLDDIPVVVLTAMNDAESELRALELGASDVITKPFDGRKVLRRIENIIARIEIESIKSNYRILQTKQAESERHRLLRELSSTVTCDYDIIANEHFVSENISVYFPGDYKVNSNIFSLFVKYGVLHPKYSEKLQKHTAEVFSSKEPDPDGVVRASITLPLFTVNGVWEYFQIRTVLIRDDRGRDTHIITLLDNVDSDVRAQMELRKRAEFDELTGIYNKRAFLNRALEEFNANPDTIYLLVRLDIERFKVVNDLFGTENGDLVLRKISQKLEEIVLNIGVFGRFSADRFTCCFPEGAIEIADLHRELYASLQNLLLDYPLVLKMGIYRVTDRSPHIEQMCDRAQLALQTVKGNYSRHWAYYDDTMRNSLIQEQEILSDMDTALEQDQFVVYFQPIFSAATGKPRSAEALVRWVHPEKGMLSPGLFIPIFEHNGFITKLDAYVWEKVCIFLSESRARGEKVVPISVNISRLNFYSDKLCDRLIETVEKYNVPPSLIRIEITESAYTDNPKQLLDAMRRLQEYGFNIMMDDFGSGYSSLNMLKDIPIDILKIDMKFLSDLQTNVRAGSVMNNVVRMAKWLEMNVVAEGVETREQVDFLRSIGCDMLQGYFFSRPIPQEDYVKLINSFEIDPLSSGDINDFELDVLWEVCKESSLLRNKMIGAIGIYELQGDTLEPVRVNDGYYQITGSDPANFLSHTKTATAWIHEEDRPRLLAACRSAKKTDDVQELIVRRYHQDGHLLHLRLRIRYAGCHGSNDLLYFSFDDVTREEELAERNSDGRFSAMCSLYDAIVELDFEKDNCCVLHTNEALILPYGALPVEEGMNEIASLLHHADKSEFLAATKADSLASAFADPSRSNIELVARFASGTKHLWATCNVIPFSKRANVYLLCIKRLLHIYSDSHNAHKQTDSSSGPKLLMVDDNEINRVSIRPLFEGKYEIIEAENGKQALSILEHNKGDIFAVILDIAMPVMDGYEFLDIRKQSPELSKVPVIAISHESSPVHNKRILDRGANNFLKRPFDSAQIMDLVNQHYNAFRK